MNLKQKKLENIENIPTNCVSCFVPSGLETSYTLVKE